MNIEKLYQYIGIKFITTCDTMLYPQRTLIEIKGIDISKDDCLKSRFKCIINNNSKDYHYIGADEFISWIGCGLQVIIDEKTIENWKLCPCPFCGQIPLIVIEDSEGNVHNDPSYEKDPYSGLWYALKHPFTTKECLITDGEMNINNTKEIGGAAFSSKKEAIEFWNSMCEKVNPIPFKEDQD